jgi:hypothetical protein
MCHKVLFVTPKLLHFFCAKDMHGLCMNCCPQIKQSASYSYVLVTGPSIVSAQCSHISYPQLTFVAGCTHLGLSSRHSKQS